MTFSIRLEYLVWDRDRETVARWLREDGTGPLAGRPPDTPKRGPKVAVLTRPVRLPFAPVPGHRIRLADWDCGVIRTVCWDDARAVFECVLDDEYPGQSESEPAEMAGRFLQYLEAATASGWTITGGDALFFPQIGRRAA